MENKCMNDFSRSIRVILILLACCFSGPIWAQLQNGISGSITDSSGEPLVGVSILVKGTTNGTITDLDGNFILNAQRGNILHISYVGYTSQDIKIENDKQLRIVMEEDLKKLEEVVIVGYGLSLIHI